MQYGTKGLLGKNFADIEEKYDLAETAEGFGEEGDEEDNGADEEDDAEESSEGGEFLDDSFEAY
jgi:hypothetical protein